MGGRWLANLLLLLILAVLAAAIRQELTEGSGPQTLAGLDPADLRLIEVEREGEPTIRLEFGPAGWQLLEPLAVDGNQAHVAKILGVLAAPVERSFPQQAAALPELGLAPSKLRLRLDRLTLAFGGLDPLGQRRYVAADGLVHLIEDRFYHLLIAPPVDYVSRSPIPAGQAPAFATLSGVPLAAASVQSLAGLVAERVEPLGADLAGDALQVKFADGRTLRFLVSEDRRRWSRLDLKLRYVLPDRPQFELDPTAVDPTPPEPPPPANPTDVPPAVTPLPMPTDDGFAEDPMETGTQGMESNGSGASPDQVYQEPSADPFAPVEAGAPLEGPEALATDGTSPPEVRLSPEPQRPQRRRPRYDLGEEGEFGRVFGGPRDEPLEDLLEEEGLGFGDEPYKEPPQGFGTDPFAPDPALDPGAGLDGR